VTVIRPEHTSTHNIHFEKNKKLGYYIVNDEIYYSKIHALVEASKSADAWPKWVFNDTTFARLDWTIEPEVDIRELYRLRAQQLRDKYDYIRVEASGGGDSTTAIFSFLLNGIYIDEVIFRYPKTGEKNVSDDYMDTSAKNTLSECQFAAEPLLRWIATNYPKVKVTIHDYAVDMLEQENNRDESWIFQTREYFQPGHSSKHHNYGTKEHKELADSGKSICVLYGVDKPKCCIMDGKWFMYFGDQQANHSNPDVGDYTNITNEYFYWTPDFPELLVKQSHLIKNWFSLPQNNSMRHLVNWPNHRFATRTAYEAIVKSLIYPDYDSATFQVAKPTVNFENEMDHWFFTNFQGTRLYQTWEAGIDYALKNIDARFMLHEHGQPVGLLTFLSPFYYLGDAPPDPIQRHYDARVLSDRQVVKIINKKIII
jgi:hypothetical protein